MEKVLLVSQTCPRCYSLLHSIYNSDLHEKLLDKKVVICFYNDYLNYRDEMMSSAVNYLKELDPEKYSDIPYVTPVLIQHNGNPTTSTVLAIGESAIFNYLKGLQ